YPVLASRPSFELRLRCQVLGVEYDRAAKRVRGVTYVDLMTGEECWQPADVVALCSFTLANTGFLLMGGIGRAYDPHTRTGVVGKNFCYQVMSRVNVHFAEKWLNPFLAGGATATCATDLNDDNFDHSGLGFFGGGLMQALV